MSSTCALLCLFVRTPICVESCCQRCCGNWQLHSTSAHTSAIQPSNGNKQRNVAVAANRNTFFLRLLFHSLQMLPKLSISCGGQKNFRQCQLTGDSLQITHAKVEMETDYQIAWEASPLKEQVQVKHVQIECYCSSHASKPIKGQQQRVNIKVNL